MQNDPNTYDRSCSLPEALEHDKYPGEVHTHAAKIAPNVVDKDELTLAQAQKPELQFEWPLWLKAIRTELTSLIIKLVKNDYSNQSRLMMFPWKSRTRISIY